MTKKAAATACPCGGGEYARCCQPWHAGSAAPTAEALMRSRYSAYVLQLEPYLLATWHVSTRPATLELAAETATRWLGLEVKQHTPAGDHATVRFIARYKIAGRAYRMEELSRFQREDGRWYYVDGDVTA